MASKVHRVRYYNPKPQHINCISFNRKSKQLAVARGDASIEIWDLNYAPYLVKFIPGIEDGSVEALCWVEDRLLSTGLGGALVEWDLFKLSVKASVLLTGYAAWCLDVNAANTLAAVGTEQGYINLFSVENNEIVYRRLFDKQEGRIMCCKFDKTGNILVTGSINTIRVWNIETGNATCKMSCSRRGQEAIVWSVAMLPDNVVVSGDSTGRLTFWDSMLGDQIESFTTHRADILSIAVNDAESSLYCSGVDPVIIQFVKVEKSSAQCASRQWVKNVQRNIHEHDVRALVLNGEELISAGSDGYLTFSSYPPKWVMRIPYMIPTPRSSVSAANKLLLLRYSKKLEVWKLGSYSESNNTVTDQTNKKSTKHKNKKDGLELDSTIDLVNNTFKQKDKKVSLKITEDPVKLVSVTTKKNQQIVCSELSPTGEFIVYSTALDVRMLKFEMDEEQENTSLSKVQVSGVQAPCDRFAFSQDSRLMVAHDTCGVHVLQIDPQVGATCHQTLATDKYLKSPSILHLLLKTTSSGTCYLVVADSKAAIAVWKQKGIKFEHYATLPTYRCIPSAINIDVNTEELIVVYVDQKIVQYVLGEKRLQEWSEAPPRAWQARRASVAAVTSHPARPAALLCQDLTSLWVLEHTPQEEQANVEPAAKKKPQEKHNNSKTSLKVIPIKYMAGFHWIGDDEAVAIEVLPENIISQLPPVLAKKRNNFAA